MYWVSRQANSDDNKRKVRGLKPKLENLPFDEGLEGMGGGFGEVDKADEGKLVSNASCKAWSSSSR